MIHNFPKRMARHLRTWLVIFLSFFLCVPEVSAYAEGPIEIGDYLTGVTWEVYRQYGDGFQSIDPTNGISIRQEDTYRLTISYQVPAHTLNETNAQCTYRLPEVFQLPNALDGNIMNNGVVAGSYTIDQNGIVTLTFNEELINENQGGSIVYGNFQFDIQGRQIQLSEEGSTNIKFNDNIDFTLTGETKDPEPSQNELEIKKEGQKIEGTNRAKYTITVTAKEDTIDPIIVTDALKNGSATYIQNSLVITKSDQSQIVPNTLEWHEKDFTFTLPPLSKDEIYMITYEMEADQLSNNETNTLQNYAEAKSGDRTVSVWGNQLDYIYSVLQKKGERNEDQIAWTITLNEAHNNLNGWTLKDVFNQTEKTRNVHVEPAIDGVNEITLPYTFTKDDTKKYTITYTTNAEVMLNNQSAINKAILTKEDEVIEQETWVHVPESVNYDPISKTGDEITLIDKNKVETTWTVTLNLSHGTLEPGWTYTDTLSTSNSYYTEDQKEALMEAVIKAFKVDEGKVVKNENGFTSDVIDFEWKKEDWEKNVSKFQITGHTTLPKETNISFTYTATTDMNSGTVKNSGTLRDRDKVKEISANLTLKPMIEKYDPTAPGNAWSTHDRKDLEEDTLTWNVEVNIPKGQTKAIKVKDTLPKEVTYKNAYVKDQEKLNSSIEATNNEIILTLDEQFVQDHQEQTVILVVVANLNVQDTDWRNDEGNDPKIRKVHVENAATLYINEVEIKTVKQTQTIQESTVRNRIDKIDPKQSGKETTHTLEELTDGIIEWKISQYIEPDQTNALTIEDTFPDSLIFQDAKGPVEPVEKDGKLVWELNTEFIANNKGKTIDFLVRFKIPDTFEWKVNEQNLKEASGAFKNICAVYEDGKDKPSDQDEQTQTITKDRFKGSLKKEGSYDNSNGILSYTVTINPEATKFNENGDTIHIHDRLKYHFKNDYDSYRVNFLPTKAKLYEVLNDGKKKEIPESDWTLKYEVKTDEWDPQMQRIDLDMDVPDGKHLVLEYQYQVLGQKEMDQGIKNEVELIVDNTTYTNTETYTNAKTVTHSATAGTHSVTLYKADESNVHLHLAGAKFDLYQYDSTIKDYKKDARSIETTDNGTFTLSNIEFNTAYYLQEIQAPDGYLLDETKYYFYVLGDTHDNKCMPDGFENNETTHTFMNNSNIFITNKKNTISLSIEKQWKDQAGLPLSGPTKEIECSIVQFESDTPPDEMYTYSLSLKKSETILYQDEEVKVEKGTVLRISLEVQGNDDNVLQNDQWQSIKPKNTESDILGDDGNKYTRYTYVVTIDQPHVNLKGSNWSMRNVEVEVIEPEQTGKVVKEVTLNNQNNYQATVDDLKTEEVVNGNTVYYRYEVEEKPVPGYISTIEETDNNHFLIVNQKTENGGFEFPVTGTNRKQLRSYIGGVIIFGLICVCIHALNLQRKERRK